jgi:hypothetical protein
MDMARVMDLILGAVVLLLHVTYGIAPILGAAAALCWFAAASIIYLLLIAALAVVMLSPAGQRFHGRAVARLAQPRFDWAFPFAVTLSSIYFTLPNEVALPGVVLFAAATLLLVRRFPPPVSVAASAVAVALLLIVKLAAFPPPPDAADMLPVIKWADLQLLAGHNPYREDYSAVTVGPFYYLPVQWLLYLPFVWARIDPRWLNFFSILGFCVVFWLLFCKNSHRTLYAGFLVGVIGSRPSMEMIIQGHVWPVWCLIGIFACLFLRGRRAWAAVVLGILLATNQTFLLVWGLWLAHELAAFRWPRALALCAISLLTYAVIVLPFADLSLDFFAQNYVVLPRLAGENSEKFNHNPTMQLSLLNVITTLGLERLRFLLQALSGVAGIWAIWRRRPADPAWFLALCGLAYLVAVSLNVQVWKYYYMPGVLLIFLSFSNTIGQIRGAGGRPPAVA